MMQTVLVGMIVLAALLYLGLRLRGAVAAGRRSREDAACGAGCGCGSSAAAPHRAPPR
jgi:hypothetical protein